MKEIKSGAKAPDFCLPSQDDVEVCLHDFKGKWIVLYFYPKDNTSGCTKEAIGFSEKISDFLKLNCTIIGVSPDSTKKHRSFIEKNDLKVTLLSDEKHEVLERYDVWKKKKMYGHEYMGVERSTFLIDPNGNVVKIWRKVKVKGHVEEVLDVLNSVISD